MSDLPIYVCHKEVRAAKIKQVVEEEGNIVLVFEDDQAVTISNSALVKKPTPQVGMWYVAYEDGYFSFSPSAAFESGYTLKS